MSERVSLDELDAQRAKGWPDFHPEDYCHRCGNASESWATPAEVWDPVMRGGDHNGWGRWQEIICIPCFVELAGPYFPDAWTVRRDDAGIVWLYRSEQP